MGARKAQPPKHGDISVSEMPLKHMRKHLRQMTADASQVRDYHTGGVTGQGSQGSFQQGGASGADYQTTSTGSVGDADSGGASGY
jgi:transcription elongation factor